MSIRVAIKEDVDQVCALVTSLSHFYLENKGDELPVWFANTLTKTAFVERFESSEYYNVVYEVDGNIAGYLSFKSHSHLYHLFVSEDYQRQGIAKQLWENATSVYPSDCYTLRSSLFAVPIYQAFGFRAVGEAGSKDGISYQPMELSH